MSSTSHMSPSTSRPRFPRFHLIPRAVLEPPVRLQVPLLHPILVPPLSPHRFHLTTRLLFGHFPPTSKPPLICAPPSPACAPFSHHSRIRFSPHIFAPICAKIAPKLSRPNCPPNFPVHSGCTVSAPSPQVSPNRYRLFARLFPTTFATPPSIAATLRHSFLIFAKCIRDTSPPFRHVCRTPLAHLSLTISPHFSHILSRP